MAREGRRTVRAGLDDRFQEAIDAAAMRAGLIGTDAYLEEWRRETRECGDDLQAAVDAETARLDAEYTHEALERLVRENGEERA